MGIKLGVCEQKKRYKLFVVNIDGGYMTLIEAASETHAEKLGKQLVIDRFYGGVHEASEQEIESFKAMGGRMP